MDFRGFVGTESQLSTFTSRKKASRFGSKVATVFLGILDVFWMCFGTNQPDHLRPLAQAISQRPSGAGEHRVARVLPGCTQALNIILIAGIIANYCLLLLFSLVIYCCSMGYYLFIEWKNGELESEPLAS